MHKRFMIRALIVALASLAGACQAHANDVAIGGDRVLVAAVGKNTDLAAALECRRQAGELALKGDFDASVRQIHRAMELNPQDPVAKQIGRWLDSYRGRNSKRSVDKEAELAELVDEAKKHAKAKEWPAALQGARVAIELAKDRDAFLKEPWLVELVDQARHEIKTLEDAGKWEDAYVDYYRALRGLYEGRADFRAEAKRCAQRVALLAIYGNHENEQAITWQERRAGIRQPMLDEALEKLAEGYVTGVDFQAMAASGLEPLLLFTELEPLAEVKEFSGLKDKERKEAFGGEVAALLAQVKGSGESAEWTAEKLMGVLDKVLSINRNTVKLPDEVVVCEFADAAFGALDDYTGMVWPYDLSDFKKSMTAEFTGVGIEITMEEGRLIVVSPLEDTPAYKAGLMAGDEIASIDGKSTEGITISRAVRSITGPAGEKVTLGIKRRGRKEPFDVPIVRGRIQIKTVIGYRRGENGEWDYFIDPEMRIAYVRLNSFSETTVEEFDNVINELRQKELQGLILDLRRNTGGLLRSAVQLVDRFIQRGVIVSTRGLHEPYRQASAWRGQTLPNWPLVILVDGISASASEIVAGAVHDHGRGTIVGTRTFGKGSVQNVHALGDDTARLKMTTANYYLPSGKKIHREPNSTEWGVEPDIVVEMTPKEQLAMWRARRELDVLHRPGEPEPEKAAPSTQPTTQEAEEPEEPVKDILEVDPQLATALLCLRVKLVNQFMPTAQAAVGAKSD